MPNAEGCHVWTGWTNGAAMPYGKFSIGNQKFYAHRAAYERAYGPIPDGYEIDHLCQNTLCVNAEHMEAVTPEENRDRVTQRRTHCKRGHEFTEENTYWVREGARACRACRAWQDKVQKARRKGLPEPGIVLLPTPACNDMGAAYTPETWDAWTDRMKAEHGNGNGHGKSLNIEALRLLGTPRAADGMNRNMRESVENPRGRLEDRVSLLPTPRATDGTKGGPNQRGSSGDLMLPSAVGKLLPTPERSDGSGGRVSADVGGTRESGAKRAITLATAIHHGVEQDWREYEAAIRRQEHAFGRPAPLPTEPGAKGQPRLSPRFVEWLMGLPEGHVTDPDIGISRNDQLKALGNGVVPPQAAAATRAWLADRARQENVA